MVLLQTAMRNIKTPNLDAERRPLLEQSNETLLTEVDEMKAAVSNCAH